jgi:hypothetical protein
MSAVVFNTGANFAEGYALLSPVIQEIANQASSQVGLDDELASMGFVQGTVLTPDGVITAMVGPEPLQEIGEDEEVPLRTIIQGYTKGYKMKSYGLQHKCTKVFVEWIAKGAQISGADSSVLKELNELKEQVTNLTYGSKLTQNEVGTQLWAKGFSITAAFGPGSASPDGAALFGTHTCKKTGATFSNVLATALDATALESAINVYKTTFKTDNGYRVKTPAIFDLFVSRKNETAARKMLNSTSDQAGVYAGTASNANLLNVFSFQGAKVRLNVLNMLGEIAQDGSTIGNDNMWFLLNKDIANYNKAFRVFTLWSPEMKMYRNEATDSTFVKLTMHFGVDHYSPVAVMGYAGS